MANREVEKSLAESIFTGAELACRGRSETRVVKYVNQYDASYCYVECEEQATEGITVFIANSYDDDYEDWYVIGERPTDNNLINSERNKLLDEILAELIPIINNKYFKDSLNGKWYRKNGVDDFNSQKETTAHFANALMSIIADQVTQAIKKARR